MITSGTMTHRLKALEKRGFITRLPNPEDARSMLVALTPAGRERIDEAVETMSIMNGSCWQDSVTANASSWIRRCGY
jgi:DNA-binding MarR family transcriptional regulator